MIKSKRMLPGKAGIAAVVLTAFFVISRQFGGGEEKRTELSGVPDVVSSRTLNEDCYLTVVANSDSVKERRKFAEKVVRMYRENTFYTTKFSTDTGNTPTRLYITVYPEKDDVEQGNEIFSFRYDADEDRYCFE